MIAVLCRRTTQLSTQYLGYGKQARTYFKKAGLMSKGENKWASKLSTGWEKAPVQVIRAHAHRKTQE